MHLSSGEELFGLPICLLQYREPSYQRVWLDGSSLVRDGISFSSHAPDGEDDPSELPQPYATDDVGHISHCVAASVLIPKVSQNDGAICSESMDAHLQQEGVFFVHSHVLSAPQPMTDNDPPTAPVHDSELANLRWAHRERGRATYRDCTWSSGCSGRPTRRILPGMLTKRVINVAVNVCVLFKKMMDALGHPTVRKSTLSPVFLNISNSSPPGTTVVSWPNAMLVAGDPRVDFSSFCMVVMVICKRWRLVWSPVNKEIGVCDSLVHA